MVGKSFNSVCYINAIVNYTTIVRRLPLLQMMNLAKKTKNSRAVAILLQGASQQLHNIGLPPRKTVADFKNFAPIRLLTNYSLWPRSRLHFLPQFLEPLGLVP